MDLPDDLFRQVKIRAAEQGRKFKDVLGELVRLGLDASDRAGRVEPARIGKDELTGLPIILGTRPASPGMELTPERIKEILLEQEVEGYRQSSGR